MSWDNRIIWSEGTFLQPQHFQQHDRHVEASVELRTRSMRPYSWGFLELAIDESLLELRLDVTVVLLEVLGLEERPLGPDDAVVPAHARLTSPPR